MRWASAIAFAVALWVAGTALGETESAFDLSAVSELRYAFGTADADNQKLEVIVAPELDVDLPLGWNLTAIGRFHVDAYDKLEPGEPSQRTIWKPTRRVFAGDHVDFELRELFVDGRIGDAFVTVGKQQIAWGTSDGLKVLDVVNPQRFREFILEDFDESRIPLWTMNLELPLGPGFVQLIWIPDRTYHDLPDPDSLFAFTSPSIVPAAPSNLTTNTVVNVRKIERPGRFFEDSDAGLRVSTFWNGWGLALHYLYHYDDRPVLYRTIDLPPVPPTLDPGCPGSGLVLVTGQRPVVTVSPRYERTHLVGASFENAVGDFTLRGEVRYSSDRYVATTDPSDCNGVGRSGELRYVVGVDWAGLRNTIVSGQLFQTLLFERASQFIQDKIDTDLTLAIRREFWNARLIAQLAWLQSLDEGDGLLRAKLSYEVRTNLTVTAGYEMFYGKKRGVYGQFDHNDRLVLGVEWGL